MFAFFATGGVDLEKMPSAFRCATPISNTIFLLFFLCDAFNDTDLRLLFLIRFP